MLFRPLQNVLRDRNLRFASNAVEYQPSHHHLTRILKNELLALMKAVWAKPMRWFGAACIGLQNVSHRPLPNGLKFVVLLLSVPCFEVSHFCFKRAYAIDLRRMRLSGLDDLAKSLGDHALKLDGPGSKRLSIAQTYHGLRDIESRTKACDPNSNFGCGHENPSV